MYDTHDGSSAVRKVWDTIYGNFIFANYHSSMAVDNDDGRYLKFTFFFPQPWHAHSAAFVCVFTCECSGYFDTHHNVFVYKAIDAAWGGASLKSDFGGHSNHHHDNIDLFFSKGFSICSQLEVGARAD